MVWLSATFGLIRLQDEVHWIKKKHMCLAAARDGNPFLKWLGILVVVLKKKKEDSIAKHITNRMSLDILQISMNWFQFVLGLARDTRK